MSLLVEKLLRTIEREIFKDTGILKSKMATVSHNQKQDLLIAQKLFLSLKLL